MFGSNTDLATSGRYSMTEILKDKTTDPKSVELLFDETKQLCLNYINRTQRIQEQAEYIIATVYTNINHFGFEPLRTLKWMDDEIKKLNALKTKSMGPANDTPTELDNTTANIPNELGNPTTG
jgi:hypothetical protein